MREAVIKPNQVEVFWQGPDFKMASFLELIQIWSLVTQYLLFDFDIAKSKWKNTICMLSHVLVEI